jgi:hypothetical protein
MASVSFPLIPPAVTPQLTVGAVVAAAPVALLAAEADAFPLPQAQVLPGAPTAVADAPDGMAMRPDQVLMARQLTFPAPDGRALASSLRTMVRSYGSQLANREQEARAGLLTGPLLLSGQDPRVLRQPDGQAQVHPDAWRFAVQAGGPQPRQLQVVIGEPEPPPGRRRRGRAALRLELELADGVRIMLQVDPVPDGVALELCAPDAKTLERLRELQPQLEAAVARAGLRVLRWKFRDTLPQGTVHARLASSDAAAALSLPVFRAVAELALILPAEADRVSALATRERQEMLLLAAE